MNSNYNDIVDVILTLIKNEDIRDSILVSGSIVPYIITKEESKESHRDLYIYYKEKKEKKVRKVLNKLCKEYEMDIVSDTLEAIDKDFGFKVKYQDNIIGFFPYKIVDNKLTLKTYVFDSKEREFKLKTKVIEHVNKSDVIRSSYISDTKVRITSPEYIYATLKETEDKDNYKDARYVDLLSRMCDDDTLEKLTNAARNTKIKIDKVKAKEKFSILSVIIVALILILLLVAFMFIKK